MSKEYKSGDAAPQVARATPSANTLKAYQADWAQFTRWCRLNGAAPLPPSADAIGRYLADLAAPGTGAAALSARSIERRLSGLVWNAAQRGHVVDRTDRRIAKALADIRRNHARPPRKKDPISPEDIRSMVATLPFDLRGLRDRALLLTGYAGGLGRSEIVGLDRHKGDTADGTGWIEILEGGVAVTLTAKTGARLVKISRGSSDQTCPLHALEQWLAFARIDAGPVFVRCARDGTRPLGDRLSDKHVARLIKRCVLAAGLRPDLPEKERLALFSGQSLRAGRAKSADDDAEQGSNPAER